MDAMRVVVLVGPDLSDIYFANQLIKRLNVVGIVVEQQHEKGKAAVLKRCLKVFKYTLKPWKLFKRYTESKIRNNYYSMARKVGTEYFGDEGERLKKITPGCRVVYTKGKNAINEPVSLEEIRKIRPDIMAVCGSSILRNGILAIPERGVLNLHGGLSQRYRGLWPTLWAVVNGEPEYIGATVHYVTPGIDDGDIVYQGRPMISPDDNPETLYAKVVQLGVEMMVKAIQDIQSGEVVRCPLEEKGRLYLGTMVTSEVLITAMERVGSGVIPEYLAEKASRDAKVTALMRCIFPSEP